MYSLATINAMSRRAARESRKNKIEPYHPECVEDLTAGRAKIPFIGGRTPKGWKKLEWRKFVDISGFGAPGEPALTVGEMLLAMRELFETNRCVGFALDEIGQFQGYLRAYEYKGGEED